MKKLYQVKIDSLTIYPQAPQQDIYHYMCADSLSEARSLFQSMQICDIYNNTVTECTSEEDLDRVIIVNGSPMQVKEFLAPYQ